MNHVLRFACVAALLTACGRSVVIESSTSGGSGEGASSSTFPVGAGGAGTGVSTSGAGAGTSGNGGFGATSSTGSGGAGAGSTSSSSGTGGGMICPDFGDPCTACVSVACPAIYCACSNNAQCLALSACTNNCNGDPDCQQACYSAHPNGISDLYKLSGCAGQHCPSECPGNEPLTPCVACVLDTCPAAMNACLADPECVALYNCLDGCGDVDLVCQQGCYTQHGAGTVKLTALLQCETTSCGSVCK